MEKKLAVFLFVMILCVSLASAVIVSDVQTDKLYPGKTADLGVEVKNTLSDDIEDVSFALNLEDTEFTTVGSSEDSEEEIRDGDEETFSFKIKASSDIKPGDYNIPYTINYLDTGDDEEKEKTGSFGITVSANTELIYTIEAEENVIGQQGRISLKIINSGLGDVKFVSVTLTGTGFEILSNNLEYADSIESGDDETFSYGVLFAGKNSQASFVIKYKDSENADQTENKVLPVTVYTKEEALKLGIIKRSNTLFYIVVVVVLIIAWVVYRRIKKKKRNSKVSKK